MAFTTNGFGKQFVKPYIKVTNLDIWLVVNSELNRLGDGCSLNHIDVSNVTSMSNLFANRIFTKSPDISFWNTHNVAYMDNMFMNSNFDGDISMWDVSNLKSARSMFKNNKYFSCDLSTWNVTKLKFAQYMFCRTESFDCDLDKWELSSIKDVTCIFEESNFNHDIPTWIEKLVNAEYCGMFCDNKNWNSKRQYDFNSKLLKAKQKNSL